MKKIILLLIALGTMNNLLAQFQTAFNPPKYGNNSYNVHLTNCDMLTGAASPLTNIRISAIVCDGTNPALLAEAYNTSTNTIFQNTTASFFNDMVQQGISLPDELSSANLQMQLTDARGVTLVKTNGNINIINQSLQQNENTLAAGLNVLTIQNGAAFVYRSKLIKPE
jgi:hypothetical protein